MNSKFRENCFELQVDKYYVLFIQANFIHSNKIYYFLLQNGELYVDIFSAQSRRWIRYLQCPMNSVVCDELPWDANKFTMPQLDVETYTMLPFYSKKHFFTHVSTM